MSVPSSDGLCLHQKVEEKINGGTIFVAVVVGRWAFFIAFMTGKMFRPRIALKIGRFGPGFQWSKCRSIFWKENQRILGQLVLSLFPARTFLTEALKIFLFGFFYRWNYKPLLSLWWQNDWRTKYRKPHRNWSLRSWEIWIYSWVMRFFHYFFSNLIKVKCFISWPAFDFS